MLMKISMRALILLSLFLFATPILAQDDGAIAKPNGWYLELLGNGGLYSINYERRIRPKLVMRYGATNWTSEDWFSDSETRIYAFPITTSYLIGSAKHKFEVGGGILAGHQKDHFDEGFFLSLTGIAGYRYEADSGFLFRVGLAPFYGLTKGESAYPDSGATPSIGVSVGLRP